MPEESEGASRRDVLKATGAAAVGAAAFFAAAGAIAESGATVVDAAGVVHIPTSILMSIGGKTLGRIKDVGTIVETAGVVASVDSTGRVTHDRRASQAQTSVLRAFDGNETFRTWFNGTPVAGTTDVVADKRDVVLTLRGRQNSTIGQLSLTNAWPTSYTGPNWAVPQSTAAKFTESVTLICDSWTLT
jgi:hypothetical protein